MSKKDNLISNGISISDSTIRVGGDIVGRDKITSYQDTTTLSQVKETINQFQEVVTNSTELSESQKIQILKLLAELDSQAKLSEEKRKSKKDIKVILSSLASSVTTIANLANAWGELGKRLAHYFGL